MDSLEGYKILNTIRPPYHNTKYPFTEFSDDKLQKILKTINIISEHKKTAEPTTKHGGDDHISIIIYG